MGKKDAVDESIVTTVIKTNDILDFVSIEEIFSKGYVLLEKT